jgi:hypothetical protein|tara:strand:+ start:107 stop:280 length:174 start_codon:yes stop_codon:yes gene_type:complete
MPKVIFRTDFFDNNRRYRTGIEYDISDDVVLPTRGIDIIKEEKVQKPARRVSVKSEE